ncbi:disulfide bond formation protein B [Planctomycetota bacterium]|nr:disulfide bond formation protein B [Planctomycetota bacterium]
MKTFTSRNLNLLLLTLTVIVLLLPLVFQLGEEELPCPLCLLQRFALLGVALGPILNIRFHTRPRHYAISLFSALFGISVAARQVLLHILPSTPTFGSPVFGLHFYTWSFILFSIIIFLLALIFFFDRHTNAHPTNSKTSSKQVQNRRPLTYPAHILIIAILTITLTYAYATYRICGLTPCPPAPTEKFTTPIE